MLSNRGACEPSTSYSHSTSSSSSLSLVWPQRRHRRHLGARPNVLRTPSRLDEHWDRHQHLSWPRDTRQRHNPQQCRASAGYPAENPAGRSEPPPAADNSTDSTDEESSVTGTPSPPPDKKEVSPPPDGSPHSMRLDSADMDSISLEAHPNLLVSPAAACSHGASCPWSHGAQARSSR